LEIARQHCDVDLWDEEIPPPREVLLAMVLGGMQAPLYGFASVLQGTLRSFVYTLEAVRKMRAEEA
jgi:large subunit ribosomal protein L10